MEPRHIIAFAIIPGLLGLMVAADAGVPETWRWAGGAAAALVALAATYAVLSPTTAIVLMRAFVALMPVAVVAFVLTIFLYNPAEPTESRIMIAAVVVAGGWLVGFITQELRRVDEREEKRRDLIKALAAEVRAIVELNRKFDSDKAIERAEREFRNDPNYQPFMVFFQETGIMRRVVSEIDLLDPDQIVEVYAFFHLMDRIRQTGERFETTTFRDLSTERRLEIYKLLLRMYGTVTETGQKALTVLDSRVSREERK